MTAFISRRVISRRAARTSACTLLIALSALSAVAPVPAGASGSTQPTVPVIVRLAPGTPAASAVRAAQASGIDVTRVFTEVFPGYAADLTRAAVAELRRDPGILSIEPDGPVRASTVQTPAPWGLDRIDQRSLPLSGSFVYTATGQGVTGYVVDTGIHAGHQEFGTRVRSGFTAITDGRGTSDCHGHGTHVAGTLGGTTYGVAKAASLVAVRVLSCAGSGSTSGVIAAIDWMVADHLPGAPAVANLSLGGPASAALDAAIQALVNDGVVAIVAAGNDGTDACSASPARAPAALTVGATEPTDARAPYSNVGRCLDLFAPGSQIVSSWWTGPTASATLSGTSMATPHVAGAAAALLSLEPSLTPSAVAARLTSEATAGVVTAPGSGSVNRLIHLPRATVPRPGPGSGYWMLRTDGVVHGFGDAAVCGTAGAAGRGAQALDVEPFPDGRGFWVLGSDGIIERFDCGGSATAAAYAGEADLGSRLLPGEGAVSLAARGDGTGYWVFTDRGRALTVGTAVHHGDMAGVALAGPVLDSVATSTGNGYYMVASDGGIFTFGDAVFHGSMGNARLDRPVMSMAADPDGSGYWLVASDGGVFSFSARFHGSRGGMPLNRPVSGMVASPTGGGYLLVAEDGGVFTFGDVTFRGSLGANPPPAAVVSIAVTP